MYCVALRNTVFQLTEKSGRIGRPGRELSGWEVAGTFYGCTSTDAAARLAAVMSAAWFALTGWPPKVSTEKHHPLSSSQIWAICLL